MNNKQNDFQTTESDRNNLNHFSAEFISKLISAGVCADTAIDNEKVRQREQEKRKQCFRCTKTLMEKYRRIVYRISTFSVPVAPELAAPFETVDKLIDYVDTEYLLRAKDIEAKMARLSQSRQLIDLVNTALTQLKQDPDWGVCYDALYIKYINPEILSIERCAEAMDVSVATFKRYTKQGLDELTTLLWTTSDIEVSLLLEALTRLAA